MPIKLKILGSGGHAKVVLDALSLLSETYELSLYDDNPAMHGQKIAGVMVYGGSGMLSDSAVRVHVAIGDNATRGRMIEYLNFTDQLLTITHPNSVIAKSALIEAGTFIAAHAVVAPEARVARGCIINHGAIVDHEVQVGQYTHIAPNSTLGGRVSVGQGVLIGAGAVVLPGLRIGDGAIIGAGSVVTQDVQSHSIVKGVPARSGIK